MKTSGARAIALGLVTGMALLSLDHANADENGPAAKCTPETLKGQYLVAANGTLIPPVPLFSIPAGAPPSVTAAAGYSIYNGDGTGTDYVTFTVDGIVAIASSATPTKYTLNSDCTGTKTVLPSGPHFDIFVAFDGEGVTAIATDNGFAVSESDRRTGSQ